MIKVFIADDHAIVRDGVKNLIAEADDMEFGGEAADSFDLSEKVHHSASDVVLLDLNMPGPQGVDVVRSLAAVLPLVKLLIFTAHEAEHYARIMIRNGAHGFLNKSHPAGELLHAIRTVHAGRLYLSPEMSENILAQDLGRQRPPHATLSPREYDVLLQLSRGKPPGKVAEYMSLSRSTVATYLQRLKRKLGVDSLVEVVQYAHRNNLVD